MICNSKTGELVRCYFYDLQGNIEKAGFGIVLGQVGQFFLECEDDLDTFEILIDGCFEIFSRKDFVLVGQDIQNDKSKKTRSS